MNIGNDIRESLYKMRNAKNGIEYVPKSNIKKTIISNNDMSMREMLGKMRMIKESTFEPDEEKTTSGDFKWAKDGLEKSFDAFEVNPQIVELIVSDNDIYMSGSIDNKITFTLTVPPLGEDSSGVDWEATEYFNESDPDNKELIETLENYYLVFYKYWRDNELQI
jgi:hypothetical protein